jgi:hypothetical protein
VPAIPKQLNKVVVAEVTEDDDLGHELLHPLLQLWRRVLDSNRLLGMGKRSSEDARKALWNGTTELLDAELTKYKHVTEMMQYLHCGIGY